MSIAIGLIVFVLCPRLLQYLFSPATFPQKWQFWDAQNRPLAYMQTVFFWGDVAVYSFALALLLEGVVIAMARQTSLIAITLALTICTTLFNLWFVFYALTTGMGPQIISLLAVAFGGYIAMTEWRMLQTALAWQKGRNRDGQ